MRHGMCDQLAAMLQCHAGFLAAVRLLPDTSPISRISRDFHSKFSPWTSCAGDLFFCSQMHPSVV
eukprot:749232-Hanusia_phi.AAC.5